MLIIWILANVACIVNRKDFDEKYCVNISDRKESGVVKIEKALTGEELKRMRDLFDERIPYPTRYFCGHSDEHVWTPDECTFDSHELNKSFPNFFDVIRRRIGKILIDSRKDGQHEMVRINNLDKYKNTNVSLNYKTLQIMQRDSRDSYNRERSFTIATGIPFYSGFHSWHQDRMNVEKLWVMVNRDGPADSGETSLQVVPVDAYAEFGKRCSQMHMISCKIPSNPGDAIYYRNKDHFHSSVDTKHDREALSFDVMDSPKMLEMSCNK